MAASSSDESIIAFKGFDPSSSLDSGSRLSSSKHKCTLCGSYRKVFYCKDCVHGGLFYHSKHQVAESYLDKRRALLELEDNKKILEKKCLKHFETRQKADVLGSRIRQSKEKNRVIKLAVEEKKQKRAKYLADLAQLEEGIQKTSKSWRVFEQSVTQMEENVLNKVELVEEQKKKLEEKRRESAWFTKIRVNELKQIFPITKVDPKPMVELAESDDMISALAEASQMYVRDRVENPKEEVYYKIVEPTLPASGDYSAYNVWVSENQDKDKVPRNTNQDLIEHNPAFNITAGLTYTAQLIHILAFYFDVRLPHRMVYSDFCMTDMDSDQFQRRVARLNANVLYLGFSQNVDLSNLKPYETIPNLLKVMDTSNPNMGRQGPIEVDRYAANLLEKSIIRDVSWDNTDSDGEGDNFYKEWETVRSPPVVQSSQMITTQQATSMAGGLVTSAAASIASIWRGFTGR